MFGLGADTESLAPSPQAGSGDMVTASKVGRPPLVTFLWNKDGGHDVTGDNLNGLSALK